MSQTSVANQSDTPAFDGMLADSKFSDIMSYIQAEASAEIPFGVMVKHGTADGDAKALTATSEKLAGIVVHAHNYSKDTELGTTGLKPKAQLNILRSGRIWVPVEQAVAVGGAVRVRCIAVGGEVAGAFRTTADANDCIDISKFARFLTSTSGAGRALLEIDMSGAANGVAD